MLNSTQSINQSISWSNLWQTGPSSDHALTEAWRAAHLQLWSSYSMLLALKFVFYATSIVWNVNFNMETHSTRSGPNSKDTSYPMYWWRISMACPHTEIIFAPGLLPGTFPLSFIIWLDLPFTRGARNLLVARGWQKNPLITAHSKMFRNIQINLQSIILTMW